MDLLVVEAGELRQVAADELALRVEAPALRHRIEDPEPRLGVAAGRRRPLPAAVVRGQLVVDQVEREVRLAAAPVDAEVLGEKARRHHAQPVVHPAGLVDLRHRRVDQRIAGAPLAPGGEGLVGVAAVLEADAVELGLAAGADDVRQVVQDLLVEVAPDQLREPGLGAARELAGFGDARSRRAGEAADRDRAEAQVNAEIARALDRRVLARRRVVVDAAEEVGEQRLGRGASAFDLERFEVGLDEAQARQPGQRGVDAGRRRGERGGVALDRVRLQEDSRRACPARRSGTA